MVLNVSEVIWNQQFMSVNFMTRTYNNGADKHDMKFVIIYYFITYYLTLRAGPGSYCNTFHISKNQNIIFFTIFKYNFKFYTLAVCGISFPRDLFLCRYSNERSKNGGMVWGGDHH